MNNQTIQNILTGILTTGIIGLTGWAFAITRDITENRTHIEALDQRLQKTEAFQALRIQQMIHEKR